MSRLPIRLRLTLAFALAMALVLVATAWFVYARVGDSLLANVDQTLRAQATEVGSHARKDRDLDHALVDKDVAGGATLAQVIDGRGHVVRSDPKALAALISPRDSARVEAGARILRSTTLTSPSGDWRLLAVPGAVSGAVVVARSLEPREESLDHLLDELLIAGPVALILACLLGYGLAAASLRPVEEMRRRAAAVSATTPGRLPVPRSHDEISRLAVTLNEMLDRLAASFEHERRFVADASHELRTPLALLRAEIEVTLRRPRTAPELEATLRSAGEETERLSRLAEDLLLIARADQGALPIRAVAMTVERVLATVATRFATAARSAGRSIDVIATGAALEADPERIAQAIGNLVDNALSHGGGSISLFAVERDTVVELHVADEGPGFPAAFLPRAFDRFSRADEARARGGTGLGLAIADLVARAHGGHAGASNQPAGGADVWLSLPTSPVRACDGVRDAADRVSEPGAERADDRDLEP